MSFVLGSVLLCAGTSLLAAQHSYQFSDNLIEQTGAQFLSEQIEPASLSEMSEAELIDLYVTTYQETLQSQTIDETRLVGRGKSLLRIGYSYGYDRDDDDFKYIQHTFPRLRLRHRLTDRLEIRLGWSGAVLDEVTDELTGDKTSDTRYADPTIGFRYALTEPKDWFPRTAVTVTTPFDIENDITFMNRMSP